MAPIREKSCGVGARRLPPRVGRPAVISSLTAR